MKKIILSAIALSAISLYSFAPSDSKLISRKSQISFFSHTDVEDITAVNYKAVSALNPSTGEVIFSVPMQSFEFKKAMMQKHFNTDKFLDTQTYPKAKLKGKITNLSEINFAKDGVYNANVSGELTIKDVTKKISEKGTVTIKGNLVTVDTKLNIILADYHISFDKGKPSTNIAKIVEATVKAEYENVQ